MKKITAIIMCVFMLCSTFALSACGDEADGANAEKLAAMSLDEIFEAIYNEVDVELPALGTMPIDSTNEQYFLGTTGLDFSEAAASEAMINAIAYSVCLVRMNDGADVEAAKQAILSSVDRRKWICVEVPEDHVLADSCGNVIILIMTEHSDAILSAWNTVAGK